MAISGDEVNKHEFEIQRLAVQAGNFSRVLGFLQRLCTLISVVLCVYLIMQGLEGMVSHNPASLNALALVIEKLQISGILGYVVAAGTSTAWLLERRGKQRAYKKLGNRRAQDEKDDPYHPSSELDADGQTPN